MPATSDDNGVVSLRERLLSENHHHGGMDVRDPRASMHAMSDSVAVLGAEKSTTKGDAMPELDGDVQFNYESTFRFMTQRRLQRRYRGVYKQYSFTAQLVTWLVVLYTLLTLATVTFRSSEIEINSKTKTDKGVFTVVVIVVAVYVFVRVALLIRWMVYLIIIAAMVVYAATDEIGSVFWLDRDETSGVVLSDAKKRARNSIMIALLVAEVLTVAVYYFTHYTYPWLVVNDKFDTTRWWNVKRHTSKGNTLTYCSMARRLYTSKRNLVTYCGGLDDEKRPHGFGMWTDTSFHGERLTGHWDHGIPTAPYRSFEHGSGYCFVNVRIGYCHVRAEALPEQNLYIPKHSNDGLHWGVASVECSVSGGFFTFLPSVRHITPYKGTGDDTPKNAAECELLLRSPTDQVTPHGKTEDPKTPHEVHRRRFPRAMDRRFPSARRLLSSCPNLDLDDESTTTTSGSPVMEGDGKEALIMLHGYNCSLDYAMNRLAQLVALGDFPPHIHPFVFSWPSGGVLAYFQARSIGSQSDETARAFGDFVQSLADAGYTTIHLLAHSMGARVYFHALKKGYLDEVFEHVHEEMDGFAADAGTPTRRSRRARLATLTFANADYERNAFVARGGGYDLSRRFCRCITVYADGMDGALFYSELLSKESVFGPLNFSMGKRSHMLHRDPDDSADGAADSPAVHDLHDFTPAEMDEAVALVNQRGQFEGVASFAFNRRRRQVSPAESADSEQQTVANSSPSWDDDKPLEYLDMDVIDTTWMDNNVHAIRHNYFNLNPTVVEDLRYLMVEQQRASLRPGLLKTTENVYIFLVAPSHVKNK